MKKCRHQEIRSLDWKDNINLYYSIYLDDLTKPFRQFELIKAVGNNMNTDYDNKVAEEIRQNTINRRLRREGI